MQFDSTAGIEDMHHLCVETMINRNIHSEMRVQTLWVQQWCVLWKNSTRAMTSFAASCSLFSFRQNEGKHLIHCLWLTGSLFSLIVSSSSSSSLDVNSSEE